MVARGQKDWNEVHAPAVRPRIEEELADILLYVMRFADKAGIDLQQAAERKIALNAEKYPAELFRGSDRKYDDA